MTPKLPKMPPLPKMPKLPTMPGKPHAVETETIQETIEGEIKTYDAAFEKLRADIKAEQHRFEIVNDSEYWVALCFESREQKEEFLARFDLRSLGDKYVDGLAAARRLGKPLASPRVSWPNHRKNTNWLKFR